MSVYRGGFSDDATSTPRTAWQRLVADLPESFYTQAAQEISLAEAPKFAEAIINNQIQGRTLVKVN
ncbi:putative zinc-binding dehydrogenase [Escherichia coli]|nr:putative zinc-binding dehydrogenase [Escherichia coli]